MRFILILILLLQVLDVLLHLAINQMEPLRLTAIAILAAGALVGALVAGGAAGILMIAAALCYGLMNVIFLMQNGLSNPSNDVLRVPLFAFVLASLLLSGMLLMRRR